MNFPAFISYVLLSAFSPGPNNIMAMSNAAKYGLRKALAFCFGVLLGFLISMSVCALFTGLLYEYIPAAVPLMTWLSAAYLLFLAYTILRDKPHENKKTSALNPSSTLTGMVMQFINIKGILYGLTAFSVFILPHTQSLGWIALGVFFLSFMGYASTCSWALFGSLFEKAFEKHKKGMNILMAGLMAYCAVAILL